MIDLYKKRSLGTFCSEVLLLVISAFIYSIAFPGFVSEKGLGFIAFFAIIPVLIVIKNTSWKAVGFHGFLFGVAFYCFFNYWLPNFHKGAIVIVTVIKGTEMLMLFFALKGAVTLFKKHGYLLQGFIWISYAYLSESWFAGYPYGTIAYALYQYLPLIQIAEYTGIWFIIYMIIAPQAYIANNLADRIKRQGDRFLVYVKKNLLFPIIYLVVFIAWFITGTIQLNYWENAKEDRTWRVATIQHNHDSWQGGLTTYRRNFSNLRRLSLEAIRQNPDIVVWSETAFVPSVSWHMNYSYEGAGDTLGNAETAELVKEFVSFAEELDKPLLTGNPTGVLKDPTKGPIDLETGELNRTDYNSVILFDDGTIKATYNKQHLVPFTEHFPYQKQLPWLYNILVALDYNWWEKGDEPVVFESDGVKFSTPICYEDVFGYLPAEFVKNGADVIVNMTNDRWSGSADAAVQHATIATLRSVETRKSTVRSTNSGQTCMILPTGKIVDPVEQFKMTYHIYDVPVYESATYGHTFYVEHIDYLAYASIYISAIALIVGLALNILRRIKK